MREVNFIEKEEHIYMRTDGLFACLQDDLDAARSDEIHDYIVDLARRLRESIMKRDA